MQIFEPTYLTKLRNWFLFGVMLLLVYVAWLVLFIDPKPLGPQQVGRPLDEYNIPPGEEIFVWLGSTTLPAEPPFSIQLNAALVQGEEDIQYGLMLGTPDEYVLVSVSPLGYAAVQQQPAAESIVPFAPWPHVRTAVGINEIWVDVTEDSVMIRLNREIFWSGPLQIEGHQIGLYGQSWGGEAAVNFLTLRIFYDEA